MSHPRTSTSLPANGVGSPVTVDGIKYVWNTVTGRWETEISKNINIVTKDVDATYTIPLSTFTSPLSSVENQSVNHKPNEELLTVIEVDENFIQLKQGVSSLERELTYWSHEIETEAGKIDSITGDLYDSNGLLNFIPRTTGGAFGGVVSAATSVINSNNSDLVTTQYLRREFGSLDTDLVPTNSFANPIHLGSAISFWTTAHIKQVFPSGGTTSTYTVGTGNNAQTITYYTGSSLGSSTRAFETVYAKDGVFSGNTITLGEAQISQTQSGGILIPNNSSIGTEDNEIPSSFANTIIDERFSQDTSVSERLEGVFTAGSSLAVNDFVKLATNGTVVKVTSTTTSAAFIGIAAESKSAGQPVKVVLSGLVSGFTGLTSADTVHIDQDGTLTQTKSGTTEKIGLATSSTELFLFSSSNNLDAYILSRSKIGLDDISSVVSSTAAGSGNLAYNNSSGVFTFTPPDLTPYATQQYVTQEISQLVDAAPGALDTLNELAAAIGDDANFSSTVTNSLATKAPLDSPSLTGSPTAPTPSALDNSTKIATTAFVQSLAGAQEIGDLSDVDIGTLQDGQVLAYSTSAQKFINQNQSGGGTGTGGTVNFIVDGGTATTVSNDIIIFLDGGGA
jgi:hypothetical protein